MKVVWTEQSLERLQEIEDYISRGSPDTAIRFVTRLVERGNALSRFPRSGRRVPELEADDLREVIEGDYRIVYRASAHRVEILTVFEGHRQLPVGDIPSKPG